MTLDLSPRLPQIHKMISDHGGYLPVTEVAKLLAEFDITIDQLILALLKMVSDTAVIPISHFKVGAIAVGATGNIYVGANQEYSSLPLNFAVHAEQAAVTMAHLHGETGITLLAANVEPCGHCRQFLNELIAANELDVMLPKGECLKLPRLLPHSFGPRDLGEHNGLLSPQHHDLQLSSADEITQLALHAANKSYSPYAKSYCGAALRMSDGKMFSGSYLENAAFNPGLPALLAAFVHLIQSGARFADVTDAVLVQVKGGIVNHAPMTEMTLNAVCPQVKLQVYETEASSLRA